MTNSAMERCPTCGSTDKAIRPPVAPPVVVTPEQFFEKEISSGNVDRSSIAEYIRKQMFDFADRFAASKVAELTQANNELGEQLADMACKVSELEAQLQQAREAIKEISEHCESEHDCTFVRLRAEAELERMRAGGSK